MLDLCSLIWGFDESSTNVHCITSQPMCSQMWHFRRSSTFWLKVERFFFNSPVWGVRRALGWGKANSTARPWVPISSPLTHMVHLLPFWGYLAGATKAFQPARPCIRPGYVDNFPSRRWECDTNSESSCRIDIIDWRLRWICHYSKIETLASIQTANDNAYKLQVKAKRFQLKFTADWK